MNKLTENNIIDALKNFTETPSDKCWNSIANNLPPVAPQIPNAVQNPSNGFSHFFGSIAGKVILAVVAIATVATIITVINNNEKPNVANQPKIEKPAIVSDTNATIVEIKEPASTKPLVVNALENSPSSQQTEKIDNNSNHTNHTVLKEQSSPISVAQVSPKVNTKPIIKTSEPEVSKVNNTEITNELTETPEIEETTLQIKNSTILQEGFNFDLLKRPNVFTPNGDGYNDYLVFENIELFPKNRLIIINSNSVKIFEQNQYNNTWDGSNAPDGVYFYILELNNGQKTISIYGSVQILR